MKTVIDETAYFSWVIVSRIHAFRAKARTVTIAPGSIQESRRRIKARWSSYHQVSYQQLYVVTVKKFRRSLMIRRCIIIPNRHTQKVSSRNKRWLTLASLFPGSWWRCCRSVICSRRTCKTSLSHRNCKLKNNVLVTYPIYVYNLPQVGPRLRALRTTLRFDE